MFSPGSTWPWSGPAGPAAASLLRGGFELAARILAFPAPVLVACTGHAVAMGAFLLLSADDRIGAAGPYRITANEVAIGHDAARTPRSRSAASGSAPEYLTRVLALAEVLSPEDAVTAGFLDRVVPAAQLRETAAAGAARPAMLDRAAHAASKARLRARRCSAPSGPPSTPTSRLAGRTGVRHRAVPRPSSARLSCGTTSWTWPSPCWPPTAWPASPRAGRPRAQTSTPAVYELFGDKAGLVREVFFEGFRLLRAAPGRAAGSGRSAGGPDRA